MEFKKIANNKELSIKTNIIKQENMQKKKKKLTNTHCSWHVQKKATFFRKLQ